MKRLTAIILVVVTLLCTSCLTTSISGPGYDNSQGQSFRYDKRKQCYLLWGLIPLGHPQPNVPGDKPFKIRTYMNFGDWCASFFTAGIFSMQTLRVTAKHTPDDQNYFKVGDEVVVKKGSSYKKGKVVSLIDGDHCMVEYADGKIKKTSFDKMSR